MLFACAFIFDKFQAMPHSFGPFFHVNGRLLNGCEWRMCLVKALSIAPRLHLLALTYLTLALLNLLS